MKCPSCQMEIPDNSSFCNHCGRSIDRFDLQDSISDNNTFNAASDINSVDSVSDEIQTDFQHQKFKIPDKIKRFLGLIPIFIVVIWCVIETTKPTSDTDTNNPDYSVEEQSDDYSYTASYDNYGDDDEYYTGSDIKEKKSKLKKIKYRAILTCGYYFTEYNIPKGTYNLKLISGSGNAISNELNVIFAKDKSLGNIKTYKNLELGTNDGIEIGGNLVLQITSTDAVKDRRNGTNEAKRSYKFRSGVYRCGKHIRKGVYNILLVSGSGNIYISDKVNEILGFDKSYGQITKIKNVPITSGTKIELSGCTVKFTPAKMKFEKNIYKK